MVYSEQLTSNYRRGALVNLAIHGVGNFVCRTAKELAITTRRRIPMIVRVPAAQRSQKRYNGAIRYNGIQRWGLDEESIEDSVPAGVAAAGRPAVEKLAVKQSRPKVYCFLAVGPVGFAAVRSVDSRSTSVNRVR